MRQSNSRSVVIINLPGAWRAVLLLPVILAVLGSWYVVHWYIGDTIAEYSVDVEGGVDLAQLAVKWAPADPFAHFMLGDLEQRDFNLDNLANAVREYETAVTLAPNDYRYWMALGRALEASGDTNEAERVLRHVVELAPAYSYPRWHLGNLLLREGKQDEAFRELTKASQGDPQLRPQVFNLAWEVFAGDADQIASITCPTPDARADLAVYLANRTEFDKAMRIWSGISSKDKKGLRESGDMLKKSLFDSGQFHHVLEIMRDFEPDANSLPQPEKFSNAGFETETAPRGLGKFGWAINSSPQAQISIDHTQWHSGRGSLKIVFKAPTTLDAIDVSQLVIVEPDTSYRLEFYARTGDLRSASTPLAQIVNPVDKSVLATSTPLPDGTNEWQTVTLEFKTKPGMEGILIRFVRAGCGQDSVCPIFGTVWYDDFNLQRVSGRPVASPGAGDNGRNGNIVRQR